MTVEKSVYESAVNGRRQMRDALRAERKLSDSAVLVERERCASIADALAERWEASAARFRERKTRFFWIGPPYTLPAAERAAKNIDAASHGLRTVARLIREGVNAK